MVSLSLNTLKLQTYEKRLEKQTLFHITLQPHHHQLPPISRLPFCCLSSSVSMFEVQLDSLAFEREPAAPSMRGCVRWSCSPNWAPLSKRNQWKTRSCKGYSRDGSVALTIPPCCWRFHLSWSCVSFPGFSDLFSFPFSVFQLLFCYFKF